MKTLLAALIAFTVTPAFAGPFVSGGLGSGRTIMTCKRLEVSAETPAFEIRTTPLPSYVQGVYFDGSGVNLRCDRATAGWSCLETRNGDARLKIEVERNSQGIVIARVSRPDIMQRPQLIEQLVCHNE